MSPGDAPTAPFTRSIAVVIGINGYGHGLPPLETAVNDATRLAQTLEGEHGYQVVRLLDGEASLDRLTTLLTRELPAMVGPDDRVLFYFAGHGVALDGDSGPNGYLLPADARRGEESSFLHMPLVHDALLALPCRHLLVVLDACFSGAFRWSSTRDIGRDVDVVHREKYDRYLREPAWQVLTSASGDQKALDQLTAGSLGARPGHDGHSPFALALFDALAGKGDLVPAGTGDGLLLATELFLYIDEQLRTAAEEAGHAQAPQLWPLRKHGRGEFLFFVPGRPLDLPPAPPLTVDSNPWRGLASYEATDASLFFGRDAEIARLESHVLAHPLTVVLGASGTGKSSLIKAGLVPRLANEGWQVVPTVRPGAAPLAALVAALEATAPTADACEAAVRERTARGQVLLVIDQVEELVTLVRSSTERDAFLALLARLATAFPERLRVVLSLRTDFEPNIDRSALGTWWSAGRFIVAPMSRDQLRAVIEKPAERRVVYFDPAALVDTLLDEVAATPGALPLLSFALSEMYLHYLGRRSDDRAITREDYDALGGVVGALRARAESEYVALDAPHQETFRRLMLRMVVAEGGTVARRRVTRDELAFDDAAEQARVDRVTSQLVEARLLVRDKDPQGIPFIEPAHDALVRGWGRLLRWVREEDDATFPLVQRQRLTRAADEWSHAEKVRAGGLLWSDPARSVQLAALVKARDPGLNRQELAFAKQSLRGRRRARLAAVAIGATIVAAAVVAVFAGISAQRRARQVEVAALVQTAVAQAQDDPLTARLLLGSLEAEQLRAADPATRLAFIGAAASLMARPTVEFSWGEPGGPNIAMQLQPDGQSVKEDAGESDVDEPWLPEPARVAFSDRQLEVTVPAAEAPVVRRLTTEVPTTYALASPDGHLVATIGTNGRVMVRPVDARARPVQLRFPPAPSWRNEGDLLPSAMVWDQSSRRLATLSVDGVRIWDPRTGRLIADMQRGAELPFAARFDPRGQQLVVRSQFGTTATLFTWADDEESVSRGSLRVIAGHRDRLTRAHFDATGQRLFTASYDGTARLWNLEPWVRTVTLPTPDSVVGAGRISAAAFAPDGRTVAIGNAWGVVGVFDITDLATLRVIGSDRATPRALAFLGSGQRLASLNASGQAREWNLQRPDTGRLWHDARRLVQFVEPLGSSIVLVRGDESGVGASIHADGDLSDSAAVNSDSAHAMGFTAPGPTVRVPGTGAAAFGPPRGALRRIANCPGLQSPVTEVAIGADTVDVTLLEHATAAAFDRGREKLAFGSPDGSVWLRTGACQEITLPLTHTRRVSSVAFSPDGRSLLTASEDGTIALWDVDAAPRLRQTIRLKGMAAERASFTPDGRRVLALPSVDTVAYLWNADGSGGMAAFSASAAMVTDAWISPDGRWLLTARDDDGALDLWPLDEESLLRELRKTRACLAPTERQRYLAEDATTAATRAEACRQGPAR